MSLQIEFLDENPLSTLVPVHTLRPDEVCIFVDKSRQHLKNHRFMEESLKAWKNQLKITDKFLDITSLEDIERSIEEIVHKHLNDKIYMDITGGPELMTAAGLKIAFKYDKVIPVYLNPKSNCLIDIQKKEKNVPCVPISLDDYALAIGAERIHTIDDDISNEKKTSICSMSEILMKDYVKWNILSNYIGGHYLPDVDYVDIPNTVTVGNKNFRVAEMLNAFIRFHYLETPAHFRYRFASEEARHWIEKAGTWLEMYIYFKAKETFGNAYTSVEFDWNSADNKTSPDNEIDVITMKKSHPIFISCKMCRLRKEFVYEISAVAKRFGNSNAIPIIATTYKLTNSQQDLEIENRLKSMKVGLIYAPDFYESGKTASEIFNTAINSVAE